MGRLVGLGCMLNFYLGWVSRIRCNGCGEIVKPDGKDDRPHARGAADKLDLSAMPPQTSLWRAPVLGGQP